MIMIMSCIHSKQGYWNICEVCFNYYFYRSNGGMTAISFVPDMFVAIFYQHISSVYFSHQMLFLKIKVIFFSV